MVRHINHLVPVTAQCTASSNACRRNEHELTLSVGGYSNTGAIANILHFVVIKMQFLIIENRHRYRITWQKKICLWYLYTVRNNEVLVT